MKLFFSSWIPLVLIVAPACDRANGSLTSKTNVTSAPAPAQPADPSSVESIALARCERETRCENVGDGRKYANHDACMNEVRAKGDNDLTTSNCPGGINQGKLQTCLDEVRTERCSNPLDQLGRLSACRTDALCAR
jgi:Family of unknown function (DUF6184)